MDDLRFRLTHKDEVAKLYAGGNGLTICDCFFSGVCSVAKFREFCSQYHFKEYDDDPRHIAEILEYVLNRFFDKKWEQEKSTLLKYDFGIEQAKNHCVEIVKDIAAAYIYRLRELYNYRELIETDYFSSNLKRWIGGFYAEHSLIDAIDCYYATDAQEKKEG
jgi:hypothetical protein